MPEIRTLLESQTVTANTSSTVYDRLPGDHAPLVSVTVGVASGTSPSLTAKLMHSLDGSTWDTLATAAAAITTAAGKAIFGPDTTLPIGRFLRVDLEITGTSPQFTLVEAKLQLN